GEREQASTEPLPREVEIELTTDDPYPRAMLRPAGDRVDTRGPIEPAIVHRIVTEITRYDDALLTLGGFGDPLRHPQFAAILESIRSVRRDGRSLYGLAVRTRAADLTDEHIDAMISNEVDILNVTLEAWTPQLYGKLQSPDDPAAADLEAVLRKLDRLSDFRQQRKTVKPILVPEMTKAYDNVQELDAFHDGWLRRAGAVCISGYSHYARQCEDRSVIRMAPSTRVGCRRIHSRCLVLADGQVTLCDQDFNGRHAIGRLGDMAKRSAAVQHRLRGVHAGAYGLGMPPSLEQIWRSEAFERVREAHRQGRFDPTPLCAACEEWHRP
ncbi:MAG: radical SAM/SPASM domain-containing protein, partial [Phycisphaerae bacterium]